MIVTSNDFLKFSERVGKSRFLIQGAGGNLSVKENGVLWIKASGCWLQDANNRNIFVPVNYENNTSENLTNSSKDIAKFERIDMDSVDSELRPSIETSLHALMPHKYVIHTHSVNAIALSVSENGKKKLSKVLDGLNWRWVSYAKPGVSLAKEIQNVIYPRPDVLILAKREFLYVDDMADASLFVLELDKKTYQRNTEARVSHINIGSGEDVSISQMAKTMSRVVGFKGELVFDVSKPDGAPRKLLDVSHMSDIGWNYDTSLEVGLAQTYKWFLDNKVK